MIDVDRLAFAIACDRFKMMSAFDTLAEISLSLGVVPVHDDLTLPFFISAALIAGAERKSLIRFIRIIVVASRMMLFSIACECASLL